MTAESSRRNFPARAFTGAQGENLVDEAFGGSLPAFFAAFTKRRALSREEIQEIQRMIDEAEG